MAVIVGVDGSSESRRALTWAAQQARATGQELVAVHAYANPAVYYPYSDFPGGPEPRVLEEVRRAAESLLASELDQARRATEGVAVSAETIEEPQAATALTERAGPDDLLVVGSRGHGGFKGLLLGSVSRQCLHHARCPVVVVRDQA